MSTRMFLPLVAGTALALALAGCASGGSNDAITADDIVGAWGTPDTQGEPSLVFEEDGSYNGNDGCNVVGGEYTVEGDTVDLGAMYSTMMFCEGVDTWLSTSVTAKLDGPGTIVFFDESGAEAGKLDRSVEP